MSFLYLTIGAFCRRSVNATSSLVLEMEYSREIVTADQMASSAASIASSSQNSHTYSQSPSKNGMSTVKYVIRARVREQGLRAASSQE